VRKNHTKLLPPLLVCALGLLVTRLAWSAAPPDDNSFLNGVAALQQSEGQKSVITSFIQAANRADLETLTQMLSPAAITASGKDQTTKYLKEQVIPFFADYKALDSYESSNPATLSDGGHGIIHYMYIDTNGGKRKPFAIALQMVDGKAYIVNVTMGQCVPNRHPICDSKWLDHV
jgi:hypothetical protein